MSKIDTLVKHSLSNEINRELVNGMTKDFSKVEKSISINIYNSIFNPIGIHSKKKVNSTRQNIKNNNQQILEINN